MSVSFFEQAEYHWSHQLTLGLGFGCLTLSVDLAGRLLGALAIVVSIYCSLARDRRERRSHSQVPR